LYSVSPGNEVPNENGIFNPAKRKLLQIIELGLKALYVDQAKGKALLKE